MNPDYEEMHREALDLPVGELIAVVVGFAVAVMKLQETHPELAEEIFTEVENVVDDLTGE